MAKDDRIKYRKMGTSEFLEQKDDFYGQPYPSQLGTHFLPVI